jgi:hypothetical protein
MAEREGFEPSIEFPLYTLSKRAPSTTRPSLRFGGRGLNQRNMPRGLRARRPSTHYCFDMLRTLLILLACSFAYGADAPKKTPAPAAASVNAPDAEIERNIRDRFARSKINADHFTVRVSGGVAVIEGKTDVIQHKGTATRLARLCGAKRVENRVRISEEARQKAARNLEKSRANAQNGPRRVQVQRPER